MSDYFGSLADEDSPGVFINDNLVGTDDLFNFDAASEAVESYRSYDVVTPVEEEHLSDLSDNDDGLYSMIASSAREADDDELGEEEDGVTRANGVLSWKIEHSTGDHRLKGIPDHALFWTYI